MLGKVLIIEDSEDTAHLEAEVLANAGYAAVRALGGDALYIAEHGGIDAVVLDLQLPYLSGAAILASLHEHPATKDLPVIMVTGVVGGEEATRRLGAQGYILKPFVVDDLVAAVDVATGHVRAGAGDAARPIGQGGGDPSPATDGTNEQIATQGRP